MFSIGSVSSLTDEDVWNFATPPGLDAKLWPFVLLTILWRLWDAKNGEIFRGEYADSRLIINRICDDFVIWRKHLRNDFVNGLNDWRSYLLTCNSVTLSSSLEPPFRECLFSKKKRGGYLMVLEPGLDTCGNTRFSCLLVFGCSKASQHSSINPIEPKK